MDSSFQSPPSSKSDHLFDELRWVIQIHQYLEEGTEDDHGIPVTIFSVPNSLRVSNPEAFAPQLIALGPYHHWQPELYEMEWYKSSAAKRARNRLHEQKFQQLAEHFVKAKKLICAHYHRYLDFNDETIAWMMILDTSFLLEFLQIFVPEESKVLQQVPSRISHFVDNQGRKSAHDVILRDIMMLENQVPLFLLRVCLEFQCSSLEEADDVLTLMLNGFMRALCPLNMMQNFPCIDVTQHAHLLELLYSILVRKPQEQNCEAIIDISEDQTDAGKSIYETDDDDSSKINQFFIASWKAASGQNGSNILYIKKLLSSKPMKFLVKVPWKIITSLPVFSILKKPVEYLLSSETSVNSKNEMSSSNQNINNQPLIEEIMIPSVRELVNAGISFSATKGDVTTIQFDIKTATLYLPTVKLDINTEVILRNLVAYESSVVSGPLVFTRYTELMNGIIDTDEDAKLLRERGIILNKMKSDSEVAKLWNSMSRSVRHTRVPFLDKVIEDVNNYYDSRWKVKTTKFMKKYVFGSWRFLAFLAAIFLLLLTSLQAFCSVYSCARWINPAIIGQ
ncbi:putative UPF0481 protein At3g02645 [Dioscorea cayenensis subsp. rotundata]|uniref:UPF0481 protein At3g02645 n=1 Tax=Dioscorea cayennensis subsp. rotundata TaxID=55577 RepID=A0AB40AW24_DIOCR|nr:putative UPF0481 protein At3g02645 [Dioscorea cayenensis subsp. rotundata]